MHLPDLVLQRLMERAADILLSDGILPVDLMQQLDDAGIIIDELTESVLHYHLRDI